MRLPHNALILLCLAACLPAHAAGPWTIRFDGVGPLRYGMSFDQVNARLGHRLARTPETQRASTNCDQIPLDDIGRKGTWLMFVDDRFTRVDVEKGARTAAGVAPGDPVQRLLAAYPHMEQEPRPYVPDELSFTALSPDGRHAIRFETEKGKVAIVFAGDRTTVRWIEGCL